jgi:hypothetical protein
MVFGKVVQTLLSHFQPIADKPRLDAALSNCGTLF